MARKKNIDEEDLPLVERVKPLVPTEPKEKRNKPKANHPWRQPVYPKRPKPAAAGEQPRERAIID